MPQTLFLVPFLAWAMTPPLLLAILSLCCRVTMWNLVPIFPLPPALESNPSFSPCCCWDNNKSYLNLHSLMDCSMPGLPVPYHLPRVCPSSCPLHRWCHPTISSSVALFSSCLQSFLASGSFPMSWLFTSGGQIIGAPASVLPVSIQGWFPLRLTNNKMSLLSKGLSRVSSSTTVWKHQLFSA